MPAPTRIAGLMRLAALLAIAAPLRGESPAPDANWPSFRGRDAAGVAAGPAAPTDWSVSKRTNVRWSAKVPGLGHSSPIVWGDRVMLTTAIGENDKPELKTGLYGDIEPIDESGKFRWVVQCYDKRDGKLLWEREAHAGTPAIKRHPKSTHANSTPATDGNVVVALFGSEGLHAFDLDGKPLWKKDLGTLDSGYYVVPAAQWGFGSSPIVADGRVIVQCDVQRGSFLAAFDAKDGREIWRTPREEVPTWSTPTVASAGGRRQIIVNGYKTIAGYDFDTGKELWKMKGGGDIPVPTPIVAHDLFYITNAHGMFAPIFAIRAGAAGDITLPSNKSSGEHVAWSRGRGGNYMQTPIVLGDLLYLCLDNGVLTCLDARTGEQKYRQRLGTGSTGFTASPVASGGNLYYTSESGDVSIVKAGPAFELVAVNSLDDECMATPAISDGVLFFRTRSALLAIGAPPAK